MTKIYAQGNYIVIEANNERKTFQKKGVGFEIVNYNGLYSLNDKGLPIGDFNYSEVKKEDGSGYATPLEFETFLFENTGNFNSGADVSPNVIGSIKITDTAPITQGLYILSDVGTYTNLGGLVTTADKLNYAYFDGTTWSKVEVAFPQAPTAKLPLYSEIKSANIVAGTQFIDDKNGNIQYRVKTGQTLLTTDIPANVVGTKVEILNGKLFNDIYNGATTLTNTSIPFNLTSYYHANGTVSPSPYGCTRTEKFLLKKGEKLQYGLNIYLNLESIGHINFYNLDGSFKSNYLRVTEATKATFVTGEYIAKEDVIVGMSNYEDGNYGAEYATIVHAAPPNLNKGLTFLLENAETTEERLTKVEKENIEALKMYEIGQAALNLSSTKKIGILVAGQSNTEGRVPIAQAPSYITTNDNTVLNVQMWNNGTKLFAPFKFGVNTGSRVGTTTSNLYAYDAIASYLLAQNKSQPIYLIKRAQGGTAIDVGGINGGGYWTPKTELISTGNKLIEELKERARTALAADPTLEIKAVMWHQGEGDSTTTAASNFYQNLKNVIAYIRGITGNPKLPFIFGTIATVSAQYNATVDAAMRQIDTEDPFVFLVDMSAGTLLDAYHFDATSTNNLGTAMFNILKNVV